METDEILETYAADYFDRMDGLDYDGLARCQDGRFASLAFGAAGIAYAHWHTAVTRGQHSRLQGAQRWSRWAREHSDETSAFFPRRDGSRRDPEAARKLAAGAFLYGRVGVDFVRVLVAHTSGATAEVESAVEDFVTGCQSPVETSELYVGTAGMLRATTILFRLTGEEQLLELGRELAEGLARREGLRQGRGAAIPWRQAPGPGLAHGTAGVLLALLSWSRVSSEEVAPELSETLARLLEGALRAPHRYCSRPTFVASLCNGFAGLALLALEAHAALGEPGYLEAARRAAHLALGDLPPRLDLCCGRVGVASVCAALAAVDPGGPWRRRALEISLSAMLAEPDAWEVTGLYGGEAALPCLVADLLAAGPGGPPALAWPGCTELRGVPQRYFAGSMS